MGWYEAANDARVRGRGGIASFLRTAADRVTGKDRPLAAPTWENRLTAEHPETARALTELLNAGGLPPEVAQGATRAAGVGNEAFQALLNSLGGREVVGPAGFDPEDVAANERGIQEAAQGGDLRPEAGRQAAQMQAGALRYLPNLGALMPMGALEQTATDLPRAAQMAVRGWDAGTDFLGRKGREAGQWVLDQASEIGTPGAAEAMKQFREPQSSAGPYSPDQVKSLLGALGAAAARLGLK